MLYRNALAVYTIHGLSACKTGNGRESTQRRQWNPENGAPQILDCDVVHNTVRNSR